MLIIQENLKVTADITSAKEKIKKDFRKDIQKLSKEKQEELLKKLEKEFFKRLEQQRNALSSADMNNPNITLCELKIKVLKEELSKE